MPASSSAPASIEQSVRLFRVYEALRSGDTAAISKLVRESSSTGDDGGGGGGDGLSRQSTSSLAGAATGLEGTTILHLAIQCADEAVVEYVLSTSRTDINARDRDGNTPLHTAAQLSRAPAVALLLAQPGINDSVANYQGRTALDLAKNPDVFQQLQLARSVYIDAKVKQLHRLVASTDYDGLERELLDPHLQSAIDVNGGELATEPETVRSGGTLLHEAARKKDARLIQLLLLNGADPFRRDRRGKLPQDVTKDDRIQRLLKKSPEAAVAQRGIQERTILGSGVRPDAPSATGEHALGGREGREIKGYLKKWTNYTSGYKLRWFVLEDGVLSYYKHQDDAGSACRGARNMRIAKLHMDAQDKLRFEILGKSSVKYHLKANHQVEAKRWFWALNNAIQYAKDEAKQERKTQQRLDVRPSDAAAASRTSISSRLTPAAAAAGGLDRLPSEIDGNDTGTSIGEPSVAGDDAPAARQLRTAGETLAAAEGDDDDDDDDNDMPDDASSIEVQPQTRDAFMIAAHSARLQLDLLAQISSALQAERARSPGTAIASPPVSQAIASYESAVANLKGLVGDLGRIARDREAYWHYRLEQEINVRRIWEENMAHVAREQEQLETRIGESEEKRRRTKRALRDALEGQQLSGAAAAAASADASHVLTSPQKSPDLPAVELTRPRTTSGARRHTLAEIEAFAESDTEDEAEFFDAVGAGEVEVVEEMPAAGAADEVAPELAPVLDAREDEMKTAFRGYEDPVRLRLKMDADDRPKISLWGILKSMIGKDMTKMTLPVSFNEPTSLLQRVAEDMEYTDLLDTAASRADSTERMVYVAAFAASEYASTVGRVAKPFNPLLGETYEYARPDKGYRFFIEQVSHHPPIGAAYAEAPAWEYWGESAVQSKFYGRSFDINPLGTWFLRLHPTTAGEPAELYTWKKVTSSVVGIITGSPTVDNYGPMEVHNHTTGEVCLLEFKQRGWKASSAYQVTGKVLDRDGHTRWSLGGRWNDKIYARLTPGYEVDPSEQASKGAGNQAILVWEAHTRPTGIPFNLTPFVVTLNAVPDALRPHLPPTDTRLRPDQRAMEDGEYDFAATEKNRVENKQRAARRQREQTGDEWRPKWFDQAVDATTGEKYWAVKRVSAGASAGAGAGAQVQPPQYWACRAAGDFARSDDIF